MSSAGACDETRARTQSAARYRITIAEKVLEKGAKEMFAVDNAVLKILMFGGSGLVQRRE